MNDLARLTARFLGAITLLLVALAGPAQAKMRLFNMLEFAEQRP